MIAHLFGDRQEVGRLTQARELDEHRQIDAGDHFDPIGFEKGHPEIRRRPAEHVREQQDALVAAHPLDRLRDVLSRIVDVVVPADRDGGELRQVADDHLGRVHQLVRELSVSHDDDANHSLLSYPSHPGYACAISRWRTRTRALLMSANALRTRSAIITDR